MSEDETTPAKRVRQYPKLDPDSVPVIEDWITLPDAGDQLGLSRQRAHQLAMEGVFKTLRRTSANGRPQYQIQRKELAEFAKKHAAQEPIEA